jgi:hypothetical protein
LGVDAASRERIGMTRVLVCGCRDFNSPAITARWLDHLHAERNFTHLIQGGANGADRMAKDWARTKPEIERYECKADWERYGKSAGPKRNARMLEWKPDLVVAFPGGRGTADMVSKAREAGVEVIEIEPGTLPTPAERVR